MKQTTSVLGIAVLAFVAFALLAVPGAAAPPAGNGTLEINSSPIGASVFLDGAFVNITPAVILDVPSGKHLVSVRLDGYNSRTKKVMVIANNTTYRFFNLTARPEGFGNLSIRSKPQGASIFIDDEYVNIAPALLTSLTAGKHTVTMNLTGYRNTTRMVMVIPNLTIKKMFVMHKVKKPKNTK